MDESPPTQSEQLTDDQLKAIWSDEVLPIKLSGATVKDPTLMMTGGQPGSGKTYAILRAKQLYPLDERWTEIIGDDLRPFDPRYSYLLRHDILAMPRVTAATSGAWIRMSLEYARRMRFNTILEGTWRDSRMVRSNAETFRDAGFGIHAVAIQCAPEVSRLATAERFYLEVARAMPARWTPVEAHDIAYSSIPATVHSLVHGPANRLTVIHRSGQTLFDGPTTSERERSTALAAFDKARDTVLDIIERESWTRRFEALRECRDIGPSGDEVAEMWRLLDADAERMRI